MDLKQFEVDPDNQTAELELLHPKTGVPIEDDSGKLIIEIWGPDSKQQENFSREIFNKSVKSGKPNQSVVGNYDKAVRKELELVMAATKDWKNVVYNGKELKCNPKNKEMFYKKFPDFREQVAEFMRERSNFLGE